MNRSFNFIEESALVANGKTSLIWRWEEEVNVEQVAWEEEEEEIPWSRFSGEDCQRKYRDHHQ